MATEKHPAVRKRCRIEMFYVWIRTKMSNRTRSVCFSLFQNSTIIWTSSKLRSTKFRNGIRTKIKFWSNHRTWPTYFTTKWWYNDEMSAFEILKDFHLPICCKVAENSEFLYTRGTYRQWNEKFFKQKLKETTKIWNFYKYFISIWWL